MIRQFRQDRVDGLVRQHQPDEPRRLEHLHHRFEALLRNKRYAVMLIFLLAASLGLSALVIRHTSLAVSLLVVGQCCLILVMVTILERAGNLRERRDVTEPEPRDSA